MENKNNFVKGDGITLYTKDNESFTDAVSGTFNLSLGYNHPTLVKALTQQIQNVSHISSTYNSYREQVVLKKLIKVAPKNIKSGKIRDIVGSTANEAAVKIANKYTGKSEVITFTLSHHGQTVYTTAISGNAFRKKSFPVINSFDKAIVPAPYCKRCPFKSSFPKCNFQCVEYINDYIRYSSSGNISAILIEPIFGNGGNIVPPEGYFVQLKKVCIENQILLIADEVQTGIGRVGDFFACKKYNIDADIITLAKGLGGIGIPAAAVLYKKELEVLEKYEHSFTSGGNLLTLTAIEQTINVINKEKLLEAVNRNGAYLKGKLLQLKKKYECIYDVRGDGYMWGLEIVDNKNIPAVDLTNKIVKTAYEKNKLLLRSSRYGFGNVVKIRPSLIASIADLDNICLKLEKTFMYLGLK